jgi:hypothetical protein
MNTIKYKSIEIVGATLGSDGRTCGLHIDSCGGAVKVDTKLKLCKSTIQLKVKRTITIDNEVEPVTETVELHKKRGRPKKDEQPKTTTIEVDAIEEIPTVKAFIWLNGVKTCFVGYVSKVFQVIYGDILDGRIVDVIHIGNDSLVEADRRRSKEHNGLLIGKIIG